MPERPPMLSIFFLWLSPHSGGGPARYRPPKGVQTRRPHPLVATATAGGSLAAHSTPVPLARPTRRWLPLRLSLFAAARRFFCGDGTRTRLVERRASAAVAAAISRSTRSASRAAAHASTAASNGPRKAGHPSSPMSSFRSYNASLCNCFVFGSAATFVRAPFIICLS